MHPPELRAEVRRLVEEGLKDGEIARALGMARTTVRDIRSPRRVDRPLCWRCWRPTRRVSFTAGEYAELLGFYLSDGHISRGPRTERLRISLDAGHEQIVGDVRSLLARVFPDSRVGVVRADGGATAIPNVYGNHISCLFPQHGPGPKHERPIILEPWQRQLVEEAPWSFLRGCVHADGCFFINRTGPYRYLSVSFANASADIRGLFVAACERVGVKHAHSGPTVRVYGREDIVRFASFVGAKW